jgi:hypothetical protein
MRPLEIAAPLRPIIRAASRQVGRTFLRQYHRRSARTVAQGSLEWHVALHCLRTQIEVAGWEATGDIAGKAGHPCLTNRTPFARKVTELTGVETALT